MYQVAGAFVAKHDSKRSIVALVERGGKSRMFHVERADKEIVHAIIANNVAASATMYSDNSHLYRNAGHMVNQHEQITIVTANCARFGAHKYC